ncbi:MAG: methionyl-tRNA formyltransferase [Dehalococcoidia bacterium]|jgi:methionyl-tRNA formyltransferase|nr:methionyl-tRNA formyltransferase [Dehalococcoidia bacterium]
MKIALIGQSAFGKSVLEALVETGEDDIVGVFAPPRRPARDGGEEGPPDPIASAAVELGIPVFEFKRLRDREAVDQFVSLGPELCVMAFVTDIVPMEMINAPSLGTIQYHPSLLPLHRGPSSINWPIICGETKTGLTIFWPDEGLDTGPVLMQKHVAIGASETLGSLYFNKLYPLGVEAMVESVDLVRAGNAQRIVQDESKATYEGWCKAGDVAVDWNAPVNTVFNMIRGGDPQPGANTTFNGTRLSLYDASLAAVEARGGSAGSGETGSGRVLSIGEAGVEVSADGGSVIVGRVRAAGGRKIGAAEWAESVGLKVGEQIGG